MTMRKCWTMNNKINKVWCEHDNLTQSACDDATPLKHAYNCNGKLRRRRFVIKKNIGNELKFFLNKKVNMCPWDHLGETGTDHRMISVHQMISVHIE